MTPEPYYKRLQDRKEPFNVRLRLIESLKANNGNLSQTAREFKTTTKTIRKWLKRYQDEGLNGLKDHSRKPLTSPKKAKDDVRALVVSLRKPNDRLNAKIGARKIKIEMMKRYGIKLSASTIHRILKDADLIKPRKNKYQKKRELALYRKETKPLRRWQVDTKHLTDILEIYPLVKQGIIPKYQYSARDVVTGTTFVAYAEEVSIINSMRFIWLLLIQLRKYDIPLKEVTIVTDNGSEFIGSIYKKQPSGFSLMVESFKSRHYTIPVRRPEWNGCVENFHGRIEDEFYEVERILDREDLLSKAYTFSLYFNLARSNLETGLTPREVVFSKTHIKDNNFFNIPPVILADLELFNQELISRNDVPEHHKLCFTPPKADSLLGSKICVNLVVKDLIYWS